MSKKGNSTGTASHPNTLAVTEKQSQTKGSIVMEFARSIADQSLMLSENVELVLAPISGAAPPLSSCLVDGTDMPAYFSQLYTTLGAIQSNLNRIQSALYRVEL